jgi:Ferritin-like domain
MFSLTRNSSSDQKVDPGNELTRRRFLGRAGAAAGATAALASGGFLLASGQKVDAQTADIDPAVLNFALNLEYLEAEYYIRATTGTGIEAHGVGIDGAGTLGPVIIKPNPKVPFLSDFLQDVGSEIAHDELNHVRFLRSALNAVAPGTAVAQPKIDLLNSFNTLAQAAGLGSSFDPFANEVNFLIGAFIFEDVGVTAYHGAAPLITSKTYLAAAAGILAVEAYHAGIIRTLLYELGPRTREAANKISSLRNTLSDEGGGVTDQGIEINGEPNLVPTNANSIAFTRSTREVLNIVYGAVGASSGLFFPNGLNGFIH